MNKRIEACLNCPYPDCIGNYPSCQTIGKAKQRYDNFCCLGRGEAMTLICLLAKIGCNRKEISEITAAPINQISNHLRYAVNKGVITKELNQSTLIRPIASHENKQ